MRLSTATMHGNLSAVLFSAAAKGHWLQIDSKAIEPPITRMALIEPIDESNPIRDMRVISG